MHPNQAGVEVHFARSLADMANLTDIAALDAFMADNSYVDGFVASGHVSRVSRSRFRCVAAPDSLKSETFCCDLPILINPAAERSAATVSTTVHLLSVSDAQDRSLKPREALERR